MNDQGDPEYTGRFVGWSLSFWGESKDPSKASLYALQNDGIFPIPPIESNWESNVESTSTYRSTAHAKPTALLPTSHGEAAGETSKPAFPQSRTTRFSQSTITSTAQASDADHAALHHMNALIYFGAIIAVGLSVGLLGLICRWRSRRRPRGDYEAIPAEALESGKASIDRPSKEVPHVI